MLGSVLDLAAWASWDTPLRWPGRRFSGAATIAGSPKRFALDSIIPSSRTPPPRSPQLRPLVTPAPATPSHQSIFAALVELHPTTCPTCRAPLGPADYPACRSCGDELVVDLALVESRSHQILLGTIGLAAGFG